MCRCIVTVTVLLLLIPGDMNTVLKTTVLLTTMDNFAILNKIYAAAFGDHKPARATFACVSLPKNALIEIECIAHVKN